MTDTVVKIMEDMLANDPRWFNGDDFICRYCEQKEIKGDPIVHLERCPWQRARNLRNVGALGR